MVEPVFEKELIMTLQVRMNQHPVGQGGFFTGSLDVGATPFRWAYDCGSNQLDPLVQEIASVAAQGDLDVLFLSHLDSDHVSGIDVLLSQCRVGEVVLPYFFLGSLGRHHCARCKWRSAKRIACGSCRRHRGMVRCPRRGSCDFCQCRDDGGDGAPDLPTPEGDGEGPVQANWTQQPHMISQAGGANPDSKFEEFQKRGTRRAETRVLENGPGWIAVRQATC